MWLPMPMNYYDFQPEAGDAAGPKKKKESRS